MPKVGRPRSCECGECHKCKRAEYMREWWGKLTPDEKRAKIAQRDPERVAEEYKKRQKKRRADRPELKVKERARAVINHAVSRGELVRPSACEECSGPGREYKDGRAGIHAHHDDYSKPLEVRWLCGNCHDAVHGFGAAEAKAA